MHVALVGPGALGCLLAFRLTRGDRNGEYRFTLLDHNVTRARTLAAQGIRYHYKDETEQAILPVSSSPSEIGIVDVVILCVKSYDVSDCLGFIAPLLGPDTLLLFMQNGVAHLEVDIPRHKGTPAYGTTTEGANLMGPGQVRHAGKGLTQLGFLGPVQESAEQKLRRITALFDNSGLKARITEQILSRLWTKLIVNAGINGLTAIFGCSNGELLTLPAAAEQMEQLVAEACDVALAAEIEVPRNALVITREICEKTAANVSSMLQDVRRRRRTEIDAINGAVVAAGRRLGIATPANAELVLRVKELERSYLQNLE